MANTCGRQAKIYERKQKQEFHGRKRCQSQSKDIFKGTWTVIVSWRE